MKGDKVQVAENILQNPSYLYILFFVRSFFRYFFSVGKQFFSSVNGLNCNPQSGELNKVRTIRHATPATFQQQG